MPVDERGLIIRTPEEIRKFKEDLENFNETFDDPECSPCTPEELKEFKPGRPMLGRIGAYQIYFEGGPTLEEHRETIKRYDEQFSNCEKIIGEDSIVYRVKYPDTVSSVEETVSKENVLEEVL
jgi:hypothetical protein